MHATHPVRFLATFALATACFDPADGDPSGSATNDPSAASSDDAATGASNDDGPSDDGPSDGASTDDGPSDDGTSDVGSADDTGATSSAASDDGTSASDDSDDGTDASTTDASGDSSSTGEPLPLERIVFITSGEFSAQAVPEAADRCQEAADVAGLPGTYLAWVSYGDFRPADDFAHFDGPYVLTDGALVADDWSDLTDGVLQHAIDHDENGDMAVMELVWTNTELDGSATFVGSSPNDCSDFTSTDADEYAAMGRSNYTDDAWTEYDSYVCSLSARFYCFQQ